MGAENISNDGCSQRDSAEHKGYVRAHRSFNLFRSAYHHHPPGQSWHSRERASFGLWELSVSRERVM